MYGVVTTDRIYSFRIQLTEARARALTPRWLVHELKAKKARRWREHLVRTAEKYQELSRQGYSVTCKVPRSRKARAERRLSIEVRVLPFGLEDIDGTCS